MNVILTMHHGGYIVGTVLTDVIGDGANFLGTVDGKEVSVPKYKCSIANQSSQQQTRQLASSTKEETIKSNALDDVEFETASNKVVEQSRDWFLNQQIDRLESESPSYLDERARASYLT